MTGIVDIDVNSLQPLTEYTTRYSTYNFKDGQYYYRIVNDQVEIYSRKRGGLYQMTPTRRTGGIGYRLKPLTGPPIDARVRNIPKLIQ
jgi:hypothetical protein